MPDTRCVIAVAATLLLGGGVGARARAATAGARAGESETRWLEVSARYWLPDAASSRTDVRWWSETSVLVVGPHTGVREHRLAEAMPEVRRLLTEGVPPSPAREFDELIATSEGRVAVADGGGHLRWGRGERSEGASDRAVEPDVARWRLFGDLDLRGSRLLILGDVRPARHASAAHDGVLWTMDLDRPERGPRLLFADPEAPLGGRSEAIRSSHRFDLGSVRVSKEGEILLFPGYRPQLLRLSPTGRLLASWDLVANGAMRSWNDPDALMGSDESGMRFEDWVRLGPVVDEALLDGGNNPVLIVREPANPDPSWWLVRLDDDGAHRWRIPLEKAREQARLRADLSPSGELVILAGDRSMHWHGGPTEVLVASLPEVAPREPAAPSVGSPAWGGLVDLTHPFDARTVYWPTATSGFALERLAHGRTAAGFFYAANAFCAPEHGGTHLDAPIHFAEGRRTADEIPLEQLITQAVVIDVAAQAAADPDYRLTVADVERWEVAHGRVPRGAAVLLRTGWSARWPDRKRYLGDDTPGDASRLHFPAYGVEAATLLVHQRGVAALGLDTASLDHGPSKDFPVHRVAAAANVVGYENLTNLDAVPPTGAWLIALPTKIAGGTGGPLRAVAVIP